MHRIQILSKASVSSGRFSHQQLQERTVCSVLSGLLEVRANNLSLPTNVSWCLCISLGRSVREGGFQEPAGGMERLLIGRQDMFLLLLLILCFFLKSQQVSPKFLWQFNHLYCVQCTGRGACVSNTSEEPALLRLQLHFAIPVTVRGRCQGRKVWELEDEMLTVNFVNVDCFLLI